MTDFKFRNNFVATTQYKKSINNFQELFLEKDIPFLPVDDFQNEDWNGMYCEAKKLEAQYVHHRASESQGWESLCIHGLSSVHTDHHPRYGYPDRESAPYKWTDVSNFCPIITKFFKNKFGYIHYDRIRIMKLKAGGYISPHQDWHNYEESRLGPINIALNNPKECKFFMDNVGILPFSAGSVIKLNLFFKHAVYNESNEDRYHLIVHGKMDTVWKQRLLKSYKKLQT